MTVRREDPSAEEQASGRLADEEVEDTFEKAVGEGEQRLNRTWPGMMATGMVGGIDVRGPVSFMPSWSR